MILSGRDIQWYRDKRLLKIEPIEPSQVQQNGIDLVLEEVVLQGLNFWLGATRETLTLPDNLMGFVQLRSTWARRGFLIPPTIIDAGFSGNLTVELWSVLESPEVAVGKLFLHIAFALLTSPGESYRGKYQGQSGITNAKE